MKTSTTIGILLLILIVAGIYYATTDRSPSVNNVDTTGNATQTPISGTTTGTSTSTTTPASGAVSVDIRNFAYVPATLTVKKGTKVTWTNNDTAPHDVTSVTGTVLQSPRLTTGQSFSYTFDTTGTFNYYCTIHPNMRATVVVVE